jgi:hypothetical protein
VGSPWQNSGAVNVDLTQRATRLALIAIGGLAAGVILAASIVGAQHFNSGSMLSGQDAHAYWGAVRTVWPYGDPAGTYGAYLYSPAFVQVFRPLLVLPWAQFLGLWTVMLMGVLLVLTGPVLFALLLPLAFFELWGGNIHLLMALAIVIGFRFPAAWSFILLTKVTPGVGLLWFAARKEWRNLAIAVGATLAVVAVSWAVDPILWRQWVDMLIQAPGGPPAPGSIAISPVIRLPLAAFIVVLAARTERRWLLPVGVFIALPVLWWGGLSLLIAVVALERETIETKVMEAIAAGRRAVQVAAARGGMVAEPEA